MKIEIEIDTEQARQESQRAAVHALRALFVRGEYGVKNGEAYNAVAAEVARQVATLPIAELVAQAIAERSAPLIDTIVTDALTAALKKHGKAMLHALIERAKEQAE